MTLEVALAVGCMVALAAAGQTVAGFGFSLLAVPLMGLVIDPKSAVVVALLLLIVSSALLVWSEYEHVEWAAMRVLLAGAVPGLPIGVVILDVASIAVLRVGLASAVLVAVIVLLRGATISTRHRGVELAAGFATGVLTTSLNTNGPPTVLALQARQLAPEQFRPTTSAVLGLTSVVGAALMVIAGRISGEVVEATAVGLPCLLVGSLVGSRVRRRVSVVAFRRLIIGVLVAAAIATLLAALRS